MSKGSGITARTERVYDIADPKDRDAWLASMGEDAFTFAGNVDRLAAWAKTTREKAERDRRRFSWDDDSEESYAWRIDHYIGMVRDYIKRGDANGAARIALEVGRLAEQARVKFAWEPTMLHGARMKQGRKIGTVGPVRKAIANLLARSPELKNAELWAAIRAKPPKDCEVCENRAGKYIETPRATMSYHTFATVASEERRKLKR